MFKEMHYVYAVYKERGFSKAAQSLHVTQPVVSNMVKRAEREFHAQIFDRTTSPISLTPAGQFYIQAIEKILSVQDEVLGLFADTKFHRNGQLRLGASSFMCTYILPPILTDFKEAYPLADVQWKEAHNEGLIKMLQDGELDLVVEADEFDPSVFDSFIFNWESLILAVPRGSGVNQGLSEYCYTGAEISRGEHRRNPRGSVSLNRFSREPFVFLQDSNDITMRSTLLCKRAGFHPDVVMKVDQLVTAYSLAKKGAGSTILPDNIPQYIDDAGSLLFYTLESPLVHRTVKLYRCRNRPQPPMVEEFWSFARRLSPISAAP